MNMFVNKKTKSFFKLSNTMLNYSDKEKCLQVSLVTKDEGSLVHIGIMIFPRIFIIGT